MDEDEIYDINRNGNTTKNRSINKYVQCNHKGLLENEISISDNSIMVTHDVMDTSASDIAKISDVTTASLNSLSVLWFASMETPEYIYIYHIYI